MKGESKVNETILFALLEPYADWEAAYLASALQMLAPDRYNVRTVALNHAPVRSMGGFATLPDFDVSGAPDRFRALVLVGGMSWREPQARAFLPLIERARAQGALLAAICDAAGFLGTLGALNDAKHTANDLDDLKRWAGPAYAGEARFIRAQAVTDRNIVTANGTAALEFARAVLLSLGAAPERAVQEWYEFHKEGASRANLPAALQGGNLG